MAHADWASAVLNNGLGHYQEAMAAAQRAIDHPELAIPPWATVDLIEAATRSGRSAAWRRWAAATWLPTVILPAARFWLMPPLTSKQLSTTSALPATRY
jgi:hypothetical protein